MSSLLKVIKETIKESVDEATTTYADLATQKTESLEGNVLVESASQSRRMIIRQMKADLEKMKVRLDMHKDNAAFHRDSLATATRVDDAEHSQLMQDYHTDMAKTHQEWIDKLTTRLKRKMS